MTDDVLIIMVSQSLSPSLSLSLSLPPFSMKTTAHKWHVHVDLPQPGVECAIAVGWHFNPFNVDLGRSTYGAECGIDAPLRYNTD